MKKILLLIAVTMICAHLSACTLPGTNPKPSGDETVTISSEGNSDSN